eukprot:TRINITY_DN8340_c0_g1_i2.p1 TRINITY_DN8340_c0_g1~~TRINITY_DN8340_c0_g1_i2.p1  ORF type:complete len:163 (+),score=33.04 TRINITY_DN8340_c0_g1_i2:92-580(+)
MSSPVIHGNLERVKFLVGTWKGQGRAIYPTMEPVMFGEEVTFSHVGKPFLVYSQRTWSLESGAPLHAESGYLRAPAVGKIEFVVSQPSGVASVEEGNATEENTIILSSKSIVRTASAKHPWVTGFRRRIWLGDDGQLTYTFDMETEKTPMQLHLSAQLKKQA